MYMYRYVYMSMLVDDPILDLQKYIWTCKVYITTSYFNFCCRVNSLRYHEYPNGMITLNWKRTLHVYFLIFPGFRKSSKLSQDKERNSWKSESISKGLTDYWMIVNWAQRMAACPFIGFTSCHVTATVINFKDLQIHSVLFKQTYCCDFFFINLFIVIN